VKKIIISVIIIAIVAVVAIWGRQYYEARYVGADYYTMIPLDYDLTPEPLYSMSGEEVGIGVNFNLTAYNEQGEAKIVKFTVNSPESAGYRGQTMPKQGDFLLVKASQQIVLGWNIIDEAGVPAGALNQLK